jgi:uncharacterized protein (UPF0264 family)
MASCTQLLVSVRSAAEAAIALEAGADIIDIKEPNRGSLGRADDATILAISRIVGRRRLVTAALGELVEEPRLPVGFDGWLKIGMAGCAEVFDWPQRMQAVMSGTSPNRFVAVAYADWQRASSPRPLELCRFAAEHACAALLVDTCVKDGRTLLDWLRQPDLTQLRLVCREKGLPLALAGSLGERQIVEILPLEPDIIAVRGAACRGGARQATVDRDAVNRLVDRVHGNSRKLMSTISVAGSARASLGNHLSTIPSAAKSSHVRECGAERDLRR